MTAEQILEWMPTVLWILVIPAIVYSIARFVVLEYRGYKNRNAPVYTERAVAYHKHEEKDAPYMGRGYSYVYYITFHTDFGEAVKLYMTGDDFFIINEGDAGMLTWQGEKLWKFIPEPKEE